MKNFNKLFIVWCFIAFLIFGGLCTLGFIYKNNIEKYHDYEKVLISATEEYVLKEGKVEKNNDYFDVKINTLVKGKYISKDDIVKSCFGVVRVENNSQIKYKPRIKCKNYKSY